ncbi:class I SAM-dependent methyltransferase [Aliidiomarina celeris]|uniref:class I SAM-dependent methyltransferase n=1 Tax=Aliidiomarina celeris TaxID=2249428 RepID=UPI000DEAE850|nr:class I SAM-dependent methyltransferase [Aliidiomarina celeris]
MTPTSLATPQVPVTTAVPELSSAAVALAERFGLPFCTTEQAHALDFVLLLGFDGLELVWQHQPHKQKLHPLQLSFTHGKQAWRQQLGGGKQEAVVRAVGVAKGYRPKVLDATAGLGRDGMMLAHAGCTVALLERQPAVYALLRYAVEQAQQDERIGAWVTERVTVLPFGSLLAEGSLRADIVEWAPEAIYLDPMFPERGKTAAVKKDMQMLQQLVGADSDADGLLPAALALASYRVVVKRPASAPYLAGQKPTSQVVTKKHRFDLYIKKAYGSANTTSSSV